MQQLPAVRWTCIWEYVASLIKLVPAADFIKAGSDIVSVHSEGSATIHLHRTINQVSPVSAFDQQVQASGQSFFNSCLAGLQIKDLGAKAGIVLNPGSSLASIEEVIMLPQPQALLF